MFYNKHLGFKKDIKLLESAKDKTFLKTKEQAEILLKKAFAENILEPKAIYRFLPSQSVENSILIYNVSDGFKPVELSFPRQKTGDKLCLSDFVFPAESGNMDCIALFVCTIGGKFAEEYKKLKESGNFVDSHLLGLLAITCAEALAELVHSDIRNLWGFPDATDMTVEQKINGLYRGKRFSPGYSVCPDLSAQKKLFDLLGPAEIGVSLTDGFMMEPEASVSALVFHSPTACYFEI